MDEIELTEEDQTQQVLAMEVPVSMAGQRLDRILAELFGQFSRSRLQRWIEESAVTVNGVVVNSRKQKLFGGEELLLHAVTRDEGEWPATDIPLDIVYEDDDCMVVNKPVGLVVHPAPGHQDDTLLNGLLHYLPAIREVPRCGIVHRLDRDTSGVMVIAKNIIAQQSLVEQLQSRTMSRQYEAIVVGEFTGGGMVDEPIGRHHVDRKRMAIQPNGKPAVTHYRVIERFSAHTHLRLQLETGRTHQIRVHMQHIRHPIVGDPVYGGRVRYPLQCSETLRQLLDKFSHQALHAIELTFEHPLSGKPIHCEAALPDAMQQLILGLRNG